MGWLSFLLSRLLVCSIDIICKFLCLILFSRFCIYGLVLGLDWFWVCFSPNENKRPRTLSKLSDTSAWEKRKTKGKLAIQKMVVDLMELYLHRLKQRRPPYPKTTAIAEFAAQFPYEPTPDQKQVLSHSLCCFCINISHQVLVGCLAFGIENDAEAIFVSCLYALGCFHFFAYSFY